MTELDVLNAQASMYGWMLIIAIFILVMLIVGIAMGIANAKIENNLEGAVKSLKKWRDK